MGIALLELRLEVRHARAFKDWIQGPQMRLPLQKWERERLWKKEALNSKGGLDYTVWRLYIFSSAAPLNDHPQTLSVSPVEKMPSLLHPRTAACRLRSGPGAVQSPVLTVVSPSAFPPLRVGSLCLAPESGTVSSLSRLPAGILGRIVPQFSENFTGIVSKFHILLWNSHGIASLE